MKRIIFAVTLGAALSGCAQNQMAGSQGSQPTTKSFDACGMSVRFSGQPESLPMEQSRSLHKLFDVPPEGQAWIHRSLLQGVPKNEMAFCACPPEEKLHQLKVEMNSTSKYQDGIGTTWEMPTTEVEGGTKMAVKIALADAAPSCLTFQFVVSTGTPDSLTTAAAPFFSSLAAIPKVPQKTAVFRKGSGPTASERLKQLDQLLSDKLITQQDYNTRRTAILESL